MSAQRDISRPRSTIEDPSSQPTGPTHAEAADPERVIDADDYRLVFQRAPDAILIVDSEGRYIDANKAMEALTGYSREELLRMRVGDLAVEADRPLSAERFDLLRKTGRTRAIRTIVRKDGSSVSVEAHAVALGKNTYLTILRDVTDRLQARRKLERSLQDYSTLMEICHAAVVSADCRGRVTSWNPAAETLFGYTAAEAMGLPLVNLIPPSLREKHLAAYARHVQAPPVKRFGRTIHSQALRKNGSELPVEVSVAVGRHGDEQVFTAVIRDVTEHRDIVERLNDALQQLQFHVERMPLACIVWDTEFRVVEWNAAAERTFGFLKPEALGRHAYDLMVPSDSVPLVDKIWADLLQGDRSSHSINRNIRKDGSSLTCEWFNTPLCDSAGHIRGIASMVMDVSERERIESQLRDVQKFESLGVLASGVAHDFNSSLMLILGNTALLRSIKGFPEQGIEHIELIEEAGARANQLIKHLLTYARTGRHNPQPTDLNAVIRDVEMFVRSSIGKPHKLVIELQDTLPLILADRSQIEQIILNLCLNAKQAMREEGTIKLETRRTQLDLQRSSRCVPYRVKPGHYVELAVYDTGCGMDASTMLRIFDPFFTTKADGHGLGLAAVLGILRHHGAAAIVDSKVGQGTDFHVFFPVHEDTGQPPGGDPSVRRPARGKRIRKGRAR